MKSNVVQNEQPSRPAVLAGRPRTEAIKEVEAIFEQAAQQYGDVELSFGGTVGGKAKSELHEIRNLIVGRAAQEIEGDDEDGNHFKLSDWRGKIVPEWRNYDARPPFPRSA